MLQKLVLVITCLFSGALTCWLCYMPVFTISTRNSTYNPLRERNPPPAGITVVTSQAPWYQKVPDCPCSIPVPLNDRMSSPSLNLRPGWSKTAHRLSDALINFHPGATWEIRWVSPDSQIPVGQQCTYDRQGQLITNGIAAGTPDLWSFPEDSFWDKWVGHGVFDVALYLPGYIQHVLGNENNADLQWYWQNWPPNQGNSTCQQCSVLQDGLCTAQQMPVVPNGGQGLPVGVIASAVALGLALLWVAQWLIRALLFRVVPFLLGGIFGLGRGLLFRGLPRQGQGLRRFRRDERGSVGGRNPRRLLRRRLPDIRKKLPSGWKEKPAKKGGGWRWTDPKAPKANDIRVDPGNPEASLPLQQKDHVRVLHKGRIIGRNGQPIEGSIQSNPEQAHIPLEEWLNWKTWYAP